MTREEIIQALRCCGAGVGCENCPAEALDCGEMFTEAAGLLEAQGREWINVEKRLPEIGERVLTLDKRGHIHDRTLYRFDDGPKILTFRPDGLMPGKDVTHRMPLPEALEGGQENG